LPSLNLAHICAFLDSYAAPHSLWTKPEDMGDAPRLITEFESAAEEQGLQVKNWDYQILLDEAVEAGFGSENDQGGN
jgi:hypothetical protein